MGRRLLLGVVVLVGIVTPGVGIEASAPARKGDIVFTQGWAKGEPTLQAEGRGVKFFKRVSRDTVAIRVEVPGDVIELEAVASGAVRIGRKGRFLDLQMKDHFEANIAKVQQLTAGSKAFAGLDGMVASLGASETIQSQSLRSSHALLNAVRGVTVPLPNPLKPAEARQVTRVAFTTTAEGPFACWAEYASTVYEYNVQFNNCISDYWWIPGWNAACAFQFSLQSELAWFWLLSCSGGMPV